jgi:hypothetical protein
MPKVRDLIFKYGAGQGGGGTPQSSLLTGLVAYWKLDEASGNRLDSVGTRHMIPQGVVGSAAGKIGNGAVFVNNPEVLLKTNPDDSLNAIDFWTQGMTVAGWFYKPAPYDSRTAILGKGYNSFDWALYIENATTLRARMIESVVNQTRSIDVTLEAGITDAWHFAIMRLNPTTKRLELRLDDGPWGVSAIALANPPTVDYNYMQIGRQGSTAGGGTVDEVGLWRRYLSDEEVDALRNGGSGSTHPFDGITIASNPDRIMSFAIHATDIDPNGMYYAGYQDKIYKSVDKGANWTEIYTVPGAPETIRRVFCDSRGYVFVSGYKNISAFGMYRSVDGGDTWTQVLALDASCGIWGMDEDAQGNLYAGEYSWNSQGHGKIWKSVDGGAVWNLVYAYSTIGSDNDHHVHDLRVDPVTDWIYATLGDTLTEKLIRSRDGGATWTTIVEGGKQLLAIAFLGGYVYIGSDDPPNVIVRFQDDGSDTVTPEIVFTYPTGYGLPNVYSGGEGNGKVFFGTARSDSTASIITFDGSEWKVRYFHQNTGAGIFEGYDYVSRHSDNGKFIYTFRDGYGIIFNP